ncbi:hypothetical protein INS49_012719 [Diaporthe citri]|uniref:uncharacterized protein n=1 Tax=Diaporthe citri TaxID=83186 RepID=UPI001C803DBF|nr:uncharacterized protein INS49_012719 [Diaporthe citri]KAG6359199.1 hypothetical protein INS49_012719 [Diaporthe citri]
MAEQGQLKVIGVPQFTTDFEVVDISDEIQEEIIAINSIYGDGTWEIETTYNESGSSKIRTRLRPPVQDALEDDVSLNIVLPSTYPHERPEFKEASKWSQLHPRKRNICILTFVAIHELFEPGNVCMYEVLEYVADRSSLLDDIGMLDATDARTSHGVAPGLVDELQWTLWDDLDVSNISAEAACTVCMDDDLAFRMAPLPCGCHYCMTCFTTGWNVALSALEPYTCCLERVPVELIASRIEPNPDDLKRYTQMLIARDTAHPFFCGYFKNCGKLVGGFDERALRLAASKRGGGGVLCRSCGLWSCAKCRTPKHSGDCVSDPDMVRLFETADIRRCPKCSEAIEKNGGCPHMNCRSCGSHWWWKKTGALVPFRGYGMHDDDDWL